jgi:hypothetical protein
MTKIAGSGSISQRNGFADPDPDPHRNVMDPEHCSIIVYKSLFRREVATITMLAERKVVGWNYTIQYRNEVKNSCMVSANLTRERFPSPQIY